MAGSRTERIGTIFTRVTALLRSGALDSECKPLWYDVYKAFPPKYPPSFSRTLPTNEIRDIFYPEDIIRAKFHKDIGTHLPIDLNGKSVNRTQLFLTLYENVLQDGVKKEEAYDIAMKYYETVLNLQKDSPEIETSSTVTETSTITETSSIVTETSSIVTETSSTVTETSSTVNSDVETKKE